MKVDVFNSTARPDYRLVVRAGANMTLIASDMTTGVCAMLPLTLFTSDSELRTIVTPKCADYIVRALKMHAGAVAPTSAFHDQ